MARSRENSITTLLGLKDCKVGEVVGSDERIVVKITLNGGLDMNQITWYNNAIYLIL